MSGLIEAKEKEEKKQELEDKFTQPKWKVAWETLDPGLEPKRLHGLLETHQEALEGLQAVKGKAVVLLLGLTGSGKSTIANHVLGHALEAGESSSGDAIVVSKPGQALAPTAMGDGLEAKTLFPQLFALGDGSLLIDCPAFNHDMGFEDEVLTAVTVGLILQWASKVKVAIVIDWKNLAEKATDFTALVRLLQKFFKDTPIDRVLESCLFLINRTPSGFKLEHAFKKLTELLASREKQLDTEAKRQEITKTLPAGKAAQQDKLLNLAMDSTFCQLMLHYKEQIVVVQPLRTSQGGVLKDRLMALPAVQLEKFRLEKRHEEAFAGLLDLLAQDICSVHQLQDNLGIELKAYQKKRVFLEELQKSLISGDPLGVLRAQLDKTYQEISFLESEIKEMDSTQQQLDLEYKTLDSSTPTLYRTVREERPSDREFIFAFGSTAGVSGGALGLASGGSILAGVVAAGVFGVGSLLVGTAAVSAYAYAKKNWSDPVLIEYHDIPFVEVKPKYRPEKGELKIQNEKPKEGVYKAAFYPAVFSSADIELEFWVQNRDIPVNKKRIQEISNELKQYEQLLQEKQKMLERSLKEKESLLEEVVALEQAIKRQKFMPKLYEEKLQKLKTKNTQELEALTEKESKVGEQLIALNENLQTRRALISFMAMVGSLMPEFYRHYIRFLKGYASHYKQEEPLQKASLVNKAEEKKEETSTAQVLKKLSEKPSAEAQDVGEEKEYEKIEHEDAPLIAQTAIPVTPPMPVVAVPIVVPLEEDQAIPTKTTTQSSLSQL